ncbi:MAG TPA: hypothetical protein VFL59_11580 [Candidatus Nanopelagicales bacterium]|nr:hypothetical protein [Candidatus Nanopelagicales bacterium]
MSAFARVVAALIGLAVAASAFLPWAGDTSAWHLHVRSIFSVGEPDGATLATSMGTVVAAAGLLIALGALVNGRPLVIIGALLAVAVPAIWIFGNAVSSSAGAVPIARIQIGAFASAVGGFMALILAAVARDTRTPTLR